METCCSINCPFIGFCKDYDNNLDRSNGCVTQRLILNQVEKYKLNSRWDEGPTNYHPIPEWVDTYFRCPEPNCEGIMQRNTMKVLTSYPPMSEYRCKKCGKIHYRA